MATFRQEIERRLASNQVYYAHFVPDYDMKRIREDTTNDILKIFEKRIDTLDTEYKIKVKDTKYQTGYYNALLDVKEEILKE